MDGLRTLEKPDGGGTSLVASVVRQLRAYVDGSQVGPGHKLPPEHVLTEEFSVSRSVLREAVAALRAEGLLVSRRGSGVFVAEERPVRPFSILPSDLNAVAATVGALELRAGVEIEAAGLAAVRRKSSDIDEIARALEDMQHRNGRDASGVAADYAFHFAIARATENTYFVDFLTYLGEFLIPRQSLRVATDPNAGLDTYVAMLVREHHEILNAIRAQDGFAAREAMRRHLGGAAERYRRWAMEAEGRRGT